MNFAPPRRRPSPSPGPPPPLTQTSLSPPIPRAAIGSPSPWSSNPDGIDARTLHTVLAFAALATGAFAARERGLSSLRARVSEPPVPPQP